MQKKIKYADQKC